MKKYLIFNADDFGASAGVNRGILEAHRAAVVTSASLMVTGAAVDQAVAMARDCPSLDLGLHWDVTGEADRSFAFDDPHAVRDEFRRQMCRFEDLLDRRPTHVDSHQHAHRRVFRLFRELVMPFGVPLRGDGQVKYLTELATLKDPRIAETISKEGIELVGFADYARIAAESG